MKHIKRFFKASCNKGAFIMPKNRKEHYDKFKKLKLELARKAYFTNAELEVFLEENGLNADYTYNKAENQLELLRSVHIYVLR